MESIDDLLDWETVYHRLEIGQACFLLLIISTNVYFISKFSRISTVHLNFRILFSVLVIQYNIINVSRLLVHLVYYLTSDWVERLWPNVFCIALSPLYSSALVLSAVTVFSLGLERSIATAKRHKYEGKNGSIALILILVQVVLCLALALTFIIYETIISGDFIIDKSTDSCLATERYPSLMTYVWIFAGVMYLVGLVFFIWLYKKNKFLMTHPSDFSLTVRHQLLENLATTRLLVPSVGFYGFTLLLGVPLAVLTQIYLLNEGRDDEDFIIRTIQQWLLMTCDFYSFAFTLYAMFCFQPLASQVKTDIRHFFRIHEGEVRPGFIFPTCEEKTNIYFEHLQGSWNKTFNERKSSRIY